MLFTAPLPLGSAPESLMLGVKFVTKAVVQVTTRQDTFPELIRLSLGMLTELSPHLMASPAHDYLCESDKLVRGY